MGRGTMVLKTWSEARKIYKETSYRLERAARSYWYCRASGACFFASGACLLIGLWTEGLSVALLGWGLIIVTGLLMAFAFKKALIEACAVDYAAYGFTPDLSSTRREDLYYMLFLNTLVDQGYSHEDVTKLIALADIVEPS